MKKGIFFQFFKIIFFGGHMSFCGATDEPVSDFWWRLLWDPSATVIPHQAVGEQGFPRGRNQPQGEGEGVQPRHYRDNAKLEIKVDANFDFWRLM